MKELEEYDYEKDLEEYARWLETETAKLLKKYGIDTTNRALYNVLVRAYRGCFSRGSCSFDGSRTQLAEIACGRRIIRQIGSGTQRRLTWLLFKEAGIL